MCIWCVLHGKSLGSMKELPPCESTFCLPDSFLEDGGVTLENLIDWDTVSNLPEALQVAVPERIIPLKTTGDGNCLLHAVSRAIWGVELYFELLRVKVHEELTKNLEWYKKAAKEFNEEDWERVVKSAGKTGQHLEFVHTLALSNVIKRPIILYASDADMERYGQGESGVAATFVPSRVGTSECKQRPIVLAWQTSHKNHYVPVVGITGRNGIDWPTLKVAFPDGLPEGEDASAYLHFDAEVIEAQVVKLISEQKKEIQRRREEERQLLEGIQDTIRKVIEAQRSRQGKKSRDWMEDEMEKERFFEEEDDEEEEEEEDEDEEMVPENIEKAYIAPPGSFIRTAEGIIRVPDDKTFLVTVEKKRKGKGKEKMKKAKTPRKTKSGKTYYEGQEWDYVFPTRLEKDGPIRYVALNKNDNLIEVAERFLAKHEIPRTYAPKVAAYLQQAIASSGGQEKDREKETSKRPPAPQGKRIPLHEPVAVLYKAGKFDGILKKLGEFNTQLAANESTKNLAMTAEEGILLKRTVDTLQAVTAYNTSSFVLDEYKVIEKLLRWPNEKLFPILDIIRLMVLHPKAAEHFCIEHAKGNNFLVHLLRLILPGKATSNNCLIVLKFLCNMFSSGDLKTIAEENYDLILKICVPCIESEVSAIRQCVANLVVNYATQSANKKNELTEMKFLLLTILRQMLTVETEEATLFAIMAALGTLLYNDWTATEIADVNLGVTVLVEKHISSPDQKVAECATDILNLIQWARESG